MDLSAPPDVCMDFELLAYVIDGVVDRRGNVSAHLSLI